MNSHSRSTVALLAALSSSLAGPAQGELEPLGTSINLLAVDLWGKLAAGKQNLAFSPASIALALAMSTPGARGETQKELLRFLHVDDPATLPLFGAFGKRLARGGKVELRVANRLFGATGYPFEREFMDLLAQGFGAPLELLDIAKAPEKARLRVNDWVAEQTAKKVVDILPPASVTQDTCLLLANAVWMRADWAKPFEANLTRPEPFRPADGVEQPVPTMRMTASLETAKVLGHEIVQLGYAGGEFAMCFVLPPVDAAPEAWLTAKVLALPAQLAKELIALSLPRFCVEAKETLLLKEAMQQLGVVLAFDRKRADLSGIANPPTSDQRPVLGEVYHKAFVRVDEKGTEAAAATVVKVLKGEAKPAAPRALRFDRPFWFVLRHLPSGALLFAGKVMDPR